MGGSVRERRGRTDGERRAWGGWLNTCYRLVFGGGEAGSASGLESRQHACTPSTLEGYQCSIACLASAPLTVVASCSAPWPAPASGRDGTLLLLLLPLLACCCYCACIARRERGSVLRAGGGGLAPAAPSDGAIAGVVASSPMRQVVVVVWTVCGGRGARGVSAVQAGVRDGERA